MATEPFRVLWISFPIILSRFDSREMGLQLAHSSLEPFLETGVTCIFKLSEKRPVVKDMLYVKHRCSTICSFSNSSRLDIISRIFSLVQEIIGMILYRVQLNNDGKI